VGLTAGTDDLLPYRGVNDIDYPRSVSIFGVGAAVNRNVLLVLNVEVKADMKKIGIIINLVGVGMLVAGLTGKLNTTYETDVFLMGAGMIVGVVGLVITGWAISRQSKSG